jgi:quercetin dioxygenase-like cupin family protein
MIRTAFTAVIAFMAVIGTSMSQPAQGPTTHHASHVMVVPSELKWADVPSLPPGAQIAVIQGPMNQAAPFTARLRFPANYRVPPHSHPVIEHVTVVSGTLHMGTGDTFDAGRARALPPGSMAVMPPGTNHFVWTSEETIVQLHGVGPWGISYVNAADDPRKK